MAPTPARSAKSCTVAGDCITMGCDYNFKCAIARSCTAHYGGDTCGTGGVGAAAWESCCTTAAVTSTAPDAVGGVVYLDKYPTTSGRMRVFLESTATTFAMPCRRCARPVGSRRSRPPSRAPRTASTHRSCKLGHVFAHQLRRQHEPAADRDCRLRARRNLHEHRRRMRAEPDLPGGDDAEQHLHLVYAHLGSTIFKNNTRSQSGCYAGAPGTHSFRFPDGTANDGAPEFDQTIYDTRTLNCVDYLMAQSFCAWDGGRLETIQEWLAAWDSSSTPYSKQTPLLE